MHSLAGQTRHWTLVQWAAFTASEMIARWRVSPVESAHAHASARRRVASQSTPPGSDMPKKAFKGVIKLDIRDSKPDWAPFMLPQAPAGSPNVLIVLYDDTGQAAWSPYGGAINMPTLQKLADRGLTY